MTKEFDRIMDVQLTCAERNRDAKDLRILTLVDQGMSQRKIAAMVGCAKSHVYDLVKAAKGNEGLMNAEPKRA